jgi:hypothetical protein
MNVEPAQGPNEQQMKEAHSLFAPQTSPGCFFGLQTAVEASQKESAAQRVAHLSQCSPAATTRGTAQTKFC